MSFKQILPFIAPFVISFISAQDIQVQCGDGARSKTIPDSVYNDYDITKVVLPALRDTICPFDDQGYCALFNFCVFSTTITPPNGAPILLTINKSTEIQPGGSGNFGPCNTVMDKIFSQCITGDNAKSSGQSHHENIFYSIAFGSVPEVTSGGKLQSIFIPPETQDDFAKEVPDEFKSLISATTDSPPQPTQTAPTQPGPPQCQQDCLDMRGKVTAKADGNGQICTGDPSKFISQGKSADGNSDFYRIESFNNCYLNVAKSGVDRGNSGQYCFSVNDLNNFVSTAASGCTDSNFFANISSTPLPAQAFDSGVGMACLTNGDHFEHCGEGLL